MKISRKLLKGFIGGYINKEKYASVLRAYKVTSDATMSPERHLTKRIMPILKARRQKSESKKM